MKPGIHPEYRPVVFHDTSADVYFKSDRPLKPSASLSSKGRPIPM